MHGASNSCKFVDDAKNGRRALKACSQAHVDSSQKVPRPIIESGRETNTLVFVPIGETAFHSSMIRPTSYTPKDLCLYCLYGKGSWTRTWVIEAIASRAACVVGSHEDSVDDSQFLNLISSLVSPSPPCFIMDSIAFHESSVECDIGYLCVQRTERSPMGTLRTRSGVYGRALSAGTVKDNNWIHQCPSRAYTERCRVSLRGTRGLLKEPELWWTYSSC